MRKKLIFSFIVINLALLTLFYLVYRAYLDTHRSKLQEELYGLVRLTEQVPVDLRQRELASMAGARLIETLYLVDTDEFVGRMDLSVKEEIRFLEKGKEFFKGRKLYYYYSWRNGPKTVIVLSVPEKIWRSGLMRMTLLLFSFVIVMNLSFFYLARAFLIQPMEYIGTVTDRIRQGDYEARVRIQGSKEVLSLADNINAMAETIKKDITLLNLVIENMKLGFLVFDKAGEITLINSEARAVLKLQEGDSVFPHFPFLPRETDSRREGFFSGAKIYTRSGSPLFADTALSSFREGEKCFYALALKEIEDLSHHNNSRLLSFMRNLTFMMAHEIKNPLNVIMMITQLAEKKYGPDPMWDDIRHEEKTITGVIDIFSSLFDMAPGPFDLKEFIGEWSLKWSAIFDEKGMILETKAEEAAVIDFDKARLEMILNNLVKNVLENGKPGCRALLDLAVNNDKIYIGLKDNTGGIHRETLFRFLEGGHSTKDEFRGWGMTLVRMLLNLGGADLEIKASPGKETEVRMIFEKYESTHR
jgi:two-component system phosphate regulon sensor histidine kinase PhoR